MITRASARRIFGFVLVAAAFLFLVREIYRDAAQVRSFDWEVRPGRLALSLLVLPVAFLSGIAVWRQVIGACGARVELRPLARAWFLANLGRYVPGVVWQFMGLAQLGPSVGLGGGAIVATLLVYMGFSVLAAALLGAWLLPLSLAGEISPLVQALRWTSPLAVALVHPAVIRRGLAVAARAFRRPSVAWEAGWGRGLWLLFAAAVAWLLNGVAFQLFLSAFVPLGLHTLASVTAINALAFVAGYLVVIAPGGLGIKEGALTLLLAGLVPAGVAASLAIAARLWTIAGEVIPALLLVRGGDRGRPPSSSSEP